MNYYHWLESVRLATLRGMTQQHTPQPTQERPTQRWDAADYAQNARFVADLADPVVALLAPRPQERILDLGCGDGALTERIAAHGCSVVGIDASAELIEAARGRGLDVYRGDAQRLNYDRQFDAVFTNATLHWIPDHDAVLDGVRRALRPGGRFVGEFGAHACVASVCSSLRAIAVERGIELKMPWTFPTAAQFERRLAAHGFVPERVEWIARPTPLPSGMRAWLQTFAGPLLAQFRAVERETVVERVLDAVNWSLCDESGFWRADYTRLRFVAALPAADVETE